MSDLRIQMPDTDAGLADWQHVHNTIIPPFQLSLDDVRERAQRNRLEVAYDDDILVGCSTVRPPSDDPSTATVIARVLPAHRGRGIGEALYTRGLDHARRLGATTIETLILAKNEDGLRFAHEHGFTELERYTLPGDWIEVRLSTS